MTDQITTNSTPDPVVPTIETVELTALEIIISNLDYVTKQIENRYGLHPEADATRAASDYLKGLNLSVKSPVKK